MSFALGDFAGGASSGLTSGLQSGANIQQNRNSLAGQEAAGNALAQLYGGQSASQPAQGGFGGLPFSTAAPQQGQPQMQQPQQPAPQQGGIGGILGGLQKILGVGGQPQMGQGQPQPGAPQQGQPAQAPQQQPQQPQPQPSLASQGPSPMQPQQGQGGQQPQQGQQPLGQGPLSLPDLVKAITTKNPGISGVKLMAAVNATIPLMNAQGLQSWRQMQFALGTQRNQIGEQNANSNSKRADSTQENADTNKTKVAGQLSEGQQKIVLEGQRIQNQADEATARLGQTASKDLDTALSAANRGVQEATRNMVMARQVAQAETDPDKQKQITDGAQAGLDAANKFLEAAQGEKDKYQNANQPAKPGPTSSVVTPLSGAPSQTGSKDSARAGATPAPAGEHAPGETIKGPDGKTYRYKGGNWDDRASWEPVQ